MKSENQPNLKNKNPAWKTKEGKNNFEEWLFSLSLSFLSSVGCPFTMLYLPLTQFSIIQSWKIAIVLQRERERERERGVESVDTTLFTSLAQNELWLAAIAASAIVVLGAAIDFWFEGGGDATCEKAFVLIDSEEGIFVFKLYAT